MGYKIITGICLVLNSLILPHEHIYGQSIITDRLFNYTLKVPETLIMHHDNDECDSSKTYYDSASNIALMVSGRSSTFTDIKSYLDCSRKDLETDLQSLQGDKTLKVIACTRPELLPANAMVLHFETTAYLPYFDRCYIFFLHYKNKEVQFFFLYRKIYFTRSMEYIDKVMKSLQLL